MSDDGSDEQYIVPDQLHNGATHFPRVKTFVHRHLFPTVTLSQSNKPSWNLMANMAAASLTEPFEVPCALPYVA